MHDPLPGGRRRSIRLRTYNYSANSTYFLTLCTYRRAPIFGHIVDSGVTLSPAGRIVRDRWIRTSEMRPGVILDAFVIMPDHMHAIIALPPGAEEKSEAGSLRRAPGSLECTLATRHRALQR